MMLGFRQPGQLIVVYSGNMINPELHQITTQVKYAFYFYFLFYKISISCNAPQFKTKM